MQTTYDFSISFLKWWTHLSKYPYTLTEHYIRKEHYTNTLFSINKVYDEILNVVD